MKKTIHCSTHLNTACYCKGDIFLEPNSTYELEIDYPFESCYYFLIKTGKKGMGSNALIGKIIKIYKMMGEKSDKYSWYGHVISDLHLVSIQVDYDRKLITLDIDS